MNARHRPGDLAVSRFPGGYIIGRILDGTTDDRIWETLGATRDLQAAWRLACQHVRQTPGARVWNVLDGDDEYEEVHCDRISGSTSARPQ